MKVSIRLGSHEWNMDQWVIRVLIQCRDWLLMLTRESITIYMVTHEGPGLKKIIQTSMYNTNITKLGQDNWDEPPLHWPLQMSKVYESLNHHRHYGTTSKSWSLSSWPKQQPSSRRPAPTPLVLDSWTSCYYITQIIFFHSIFEKSISSYAFIF